MFKIIFEYAKSFLQMAINLDMMRTMEALLFFLKLKEKGWIFHQIYEELMHGSRSNVTKGQGKSCFIES